LGARAEAIAAAEEATAIYREQVAAYPEYDDDLRRSERTLEWLRQRREDSDDEIR
jgi:hypothetical protein